MQTNPWQQPAGLISEPQQDLDNSLSPQAQITQNTPVVFFEWALSALERGQADGQPTDETAASPLRWLGDIDGYLGYPAGGFEHTFEAWCAILHPDDLNSFVSAIEGHLTTGKPYSGTCRAQRADGSWLRFVHSGIASFDDDGNPWKLTASLTNFELLGVDFQVVPGVPTREQEEKARAESLLRTAAHLNAQLDLQAVCEAICEEAARIIGAPSAVMLFNQERDAFVPAAIHDMPRDYDKRYIPTLRSIYDRHVAEMGPLFLFTDAQATPDLPNHQLYLEVDMRTIGIASLIREGEVLGLLKVYSFGEPRHFDENELALLQGLADLAAQAISNARFYAESQRRLANIQSLRQIDLAILGANDVNISLKVVVDQVTTRLGADATSILLLNSHSRTLRYAVGRGFRTANLRPTDWSLGEGLAGRAAMEQCLIHVPDLSHPDDIAVGSNGLNRDLERIPASPGQVTRSPRLQMLVNEGFVSYYAVPLFAGGQVKGVLELWHRSPLSLDDEALEFLETLAGQAAIAVENANLFRDVQRSHDEIMMAYDSTLEGWSAALDLRDKETEGHSQRVTNETLRLATFMGLSDAQMVQIRRGALLHDIGKVGIPDAILLKPGPLTDDEWVIMKKHPTYALELLSRIDYLRPALEIPYSHHEKWDGSGYPLGLSGQQIPLSARIFAIVDVWDALCSDRPYRKGWPLQRVLKHIRSGAGSHFDPEVVAAFLQMHPPIEEDGEE